MTMTRLGISMLAATCVFGYAGLSEAQTLVPNTSMWSWLHPTDGTDPAGEVEGFHESFFKMDFDDSNWKRGRDKPGPHGGFGYGDEEFEGTNLGQPENIENRKTAYFRLKFTTDKDHKNLVFKCQRDDAIIVYLDEKEVLRDNIPRGTFGLRNVKDAYDLFAAETIAGEDETRVNEFPWEVALPAGEHILAISLHNRAQGSSDLRIAEISLSVNADEDADETESDSDDAEAQEN